MIDKTFRGVNWRCDIEHMRGIDHMKMKRKLLLLAAALLACFPAWALADVFVNNVRQTPDDDGKIAITQDMNGATISGSGENVYLEVAKGVTRLTLENLTVTAPKIEGNSCSALRVTGNNNLTLIIKGSNTLTGSTNEDEFGGSGITASGDLTIIGEAGSSLIAMGGSGSSDYIGGSGDGIASDTLEINTEGVVTAIGGEGKGSLGICVDGVKVSGAGVVTAKGRDYAAGKLDNDDPDIVLLVPVEADGLVIRAGESEESAVVVDGYTELTKYLRISGTSAPDGAAAIGNADLPQTGDGSRMGLWCLLACASMLGMAALRAKKVA